MSVYILNLHGGGPGFLARLSMPMREDVVFSCVHPCVSVSFNARERGQLLFNLRFGEGDVGEGSNTGLCVGIAPREADAGIDRASPVSDGRPTRRKIIRGESRLCARVWAGRLRRGAAQRVGDSGLSPPGWGGGGGG